MAQGLHQEAIAGLEKAIAAVSYIGADENNIAKLKNAIASLNQKNHK
jgi:hypothetical protein